MMRREKLEEVLMRLEAFRLNLSSKASSFRPPNGEHIECLVAILREVIPAYNEIRVLVRLYFPQFEKLTPDSAFDNFTVEFIVLMKNLSVKEKVAELSGPANQLADAVLESLSYGIDNSEEIISARREKTPGI